MSVDTANLIYAEKRSSQWELLMRKFNEVHKAESVSNTVEIPTVFRSTKTFPTNSTYEGTWNVLGISGYGVYKFPNGVLYEGQFNDGMFEGEGEMRYPDGTRLRGIWTGGVIVDPTLVYCEGIPHEEEDWAYCKMPDRRCLDLMVRGCAAHGRVDSTLVYCGTIPHKEEDWSYGKMPDRRFSIEEQRSIQPADKSFLTDEETARTIPDGYYDNGEGFYHPVTKTIYKYTDLASIVRIPTEDEQQWIVENCRKAPDLPLGPRPDLYEEFQRPKLRLNEFKTDRHESSLKNFYDPESEDRRMSDDTLSSLRHKLMVPPTLFQFKNSPYLSF